MKKESLFLLVAVVALSACEVQNDDVVKSFPHSGSIVTVLTTTHSKGADGKEFDVLTTTHNVWAGGIVVKSIERHDTIPYLGTTKEVGEDEDGNEKTVVLPKDYEFYITVK